MSKRTLALAVLCALCARAAAQDNADTLRQVVVTGTGTEHLLKDAPVQTEVISRKMLDSYGGRSLEDILGGLTASFAFNEGDMGSQMQLGGLGNSYILVLVDGKRIHGDVGGENDLSIIDPQNIDRIEIVKGAQSALYGSDAIAGVINIITRRHERDALLLENTTRYGSYNDTRQHNTVAWGKGKWTTTTNFQLAHNDGWQNTSEEKAEAQVFTDSRNKTVNRYTNWQLAERLTYAPMKDLDLYAEGWYHHKSIMRPTDGNHPSCDVYTYDLMYRNANASAGGKYKLNKTDYITLDVDWNKHAYFYEYTATTLTDGYDPVGNFTNYFPYYAGQYSLQSDQQRALAHLKGVFTLPHSNLLSGGVEYRYDYLRSPMRLDTHTDVSNSDVPVTDWTAAAYVQDEFTKIRWLNLTGGLRLTTTQTSGTRLTPKLSAMVPLGDFRLRAGWGQGFKTPTPKELHYRYLHVMGASTYYNIGNPDLRAQTSNYVNAGAEYRTGKLTVSVTAYYNKIDNMIALVNVGVDEIPTGVTSAYSGDGSGEITARMYKNMEDARTAGVDVNATYKLTRELTLGGNYSYLDTKAHEYNTAKERLVEVTIDGMAHHKWNAYATWTHQFRRDYKLSANLSARGSSTRYYQNDGNGAPYQLWRVNTTHDFKKLFRIEAGVDNIFNYVDRTMHPYHLGTKSAGTTVYVALRVQFKRGKKLTTYKPKDGNYEED